MAKRGIEHLTLTIIMMDVGLLEYLSVSKCGTACADLIAQLAKEV